MPRDLRAWIESVVVLVKNGQLAEDRRVEVKADWSENVDRTARQLAGLANAASGEDILLLVGADEGGRQVSGTSANQSSTWVLGLQKYFDGTAPMLKDALIMEIDGNAVVGMLFGTSDAPYVVRVGDRRLDVPWRDLEGTRSAGQHELHGMLDRRVELPEVEVYHGSLRYADSTWMLDLNTYFNFFGPRQITFRVIHCHATIEIGDRTVKVFDTLDFRVPIESANAVSTGADLSLTASSEVTIRGRQHRDRIGVSHQMGGTLVMVLRPLQPARRYLELRITLADPIAFNWPVGDGKSVVRDSSG